MPTKNSIRVLHPYKDEGQWMFDDAATGLVREAFVCGMDEMLDLLTAHLPNAEAGFNLIFSHQAFPGYQAMLEWRREEEGGNWYWNQALQMEGWLCPALFLYFEKAPAKIYFQCKASA